MTNRLTRAIVTCLAAATLTALGSGVAIASPAIDANHQQAILVPMHGTDPPSMKYPVRYGIFYSQGTASGASKCLAQGITLRTAQIVRDYYCWYTTPTSAELWGQPF